jgi:protein-S-isoprenylcysteine O-methyltransferase Ste14
MSERSSSEWIRLILLFAGIIVLWWFSTPTRLSVATGATLVLVGEAIRLWAAGHLFKTKLLITSGPYRFTRNPLYLGRFLILTGVAVMAYRSDGLNWIALLAAWLVFFLYYMRRKEAIEPARLRQVHGDAYEAYYRAVPALFPRLTPWGANTQSWDRSRFSRNREGWTALVLVVLIALFWFKAATDLA